MGAWSAPCLHFCMDVRIHVCKYSCTLLGTVYITQTHISWQICGHERLAEYDWKPHRFVLAQTILSLANKYCYVSEQRRGTVSSNSRFHTARSQHYSANLSSHWLLRNGSERTGCGRLRRAQKAQLNMPPGISNDARSLIRLLTPDDLLAFLAWMFRGPLFRAPLIMSSYVLIFPRFSKMPSVHQ